MGSESKDHRAELERLGVLIGRTRSKVRDSHMFLVLEQDEAPAVPQSMIETQPMPLMRFPIIVDR